MILRSVVDRVRRMSLISPTVFHSSSGNLSRTELIDAINLVEPDDYSDWSVEELQELAINLGIKIFS